MGITALPVANIAATGNPLTSTSGALSDDLESAGLPAEFAALLAQLSPLANPAPPQSLAAEAGQEAGSTQSLLTPAGPDELDQLILLAQPYLPTAQGKPTSNGVDRSNLPDNNAQAAEAAQLLAATTLNHANPDLAGQHAPPPDLPPSAGADNPLLASAAGSGSAQTLSSQSLSSSLPKGQNVLDLTSNTRESQAWQASTANIAAEAAQTPLSGSSFAAALGTAQATQAQPPLPAVSATDLPTQIHDRQWGQNFSEKIVWLAKSDQQTAQININPPQLGPLQINLNINGDQASAVFTSAHAEVRQAIEDAMPRLREMLSSAGISLGQANVGAQLPQQNRDAPSQFATGTRFSSETAILPGDSDPVAKAVALQRGRGLVDLFA